MIFDESLLLAGEDYRLNGEITIHQPTLREVFDYGEKEYFNLVSNITATPADLKWQLYDYFGLYFDKVDEFEVFCLLCKGVKQKDSKIIFGKLDLSLLEAGVRNDNKELILYNIKSGKVVIDRVIYIVLVEYLRKMNGLKKNIEKAGNEHTRKFLIDLAREDYKSNEDKHYKSILFPFILFYCVEMMCDYKSVFHLPIYIFLEECYQILRNKKTDHLLNGIYAGTVDQKKISKNELSYMKES